MKKSQQIDQKDSDIIKDLKQKLHKSFIQLSDIQKLYQAQLQMQKQNYQLQLKNLKEQNERLLAKIDQLVKKNECKNQFEIEGFDQSFIQPQLKHSKGASFIDQSMVALVHDVGINSQRNRLIQSQKKISQYIPKPPPCLYEYYDIALQISVQNSRLRDQLYKFSQFNKSISKKLEQLRNLNNELKKNQKAMKQDNQRLAQMYKEQIDKASTLQISSDKRSISSKSINKGSSKQITDIKQNKTYSSVRVPPKTPKA